MIGIKQVENLQQLEDRVASLERHGGGGGSTSVPVATRTVLGGVKADKKPTGSGYDWRQAVIDNSGFLQTDCSQPNLERRIRETESMTESLVPTAATVECSERTAVSIGSSKTTVLLRNPADGTSLELVIGNTHSNRILIFNGKEDAEVHIDSVCAEAGLFGEKERYADRIMAVTDSFTVYGGTMTAFDVQLAEFDGELFAIVSKAEELVQI